MKLRTIILACALALSAGSAANAETGGAPIYSTDILTYMDGAPIQGYAIDGRMMICLEDLANYGFSVCYNDEARALFVNKNGSTDAGFYPEIERGTVGGVVGYTYETDIRAYVNGYEVAAENIGGRLAACAEDLAAAEGSIRNFTFTYPAVSLRYTYDDAARALYLFSDTDGSIYERNITGFLAGVEGSDGLFTIEDEFECDEYTEYIIKGIYRDTSNTDGCNAVRFYKDGRTYNAEAALMEYDFAAYMMKDGVSITDMSFSDDGRYLCFSGERSRAQGYSPMGAGDVYEAGEYMLDMDTFELIRIDVREYELP